MSKIFRLYKGGALTYQDWNSSPTFPYNSINRDTIDDPDGASAKHEITSIPSPFARIDLIKTAFKEVCKIDKKTKRVNLDGKTIFHKMVSDTLDVAEIFFNIEKFKDKIEIIKWDCQQMLGELKQSTEEGHKCLGDVLDKYLQADSSTYNFDQLQNIYLLNYKNGPDQLNIIGATSPATLFFSNANDLSYIKDIYFGQDKPFDEAYQPLYKRDFALVKYLFALRAQIKNFATIFSELDQYLSETYKALDDSNKKATLQNIKATELQNFMTISVKEGQQSNNVEILGYNLYQKNVQGTPTDSDFLLKPSMDVKTIPLVLPTESGNTYANLQYTTDKWGKTNSAPYQDEEIDLSNRTLPNDGMKYPYITIGDFLEESIIRVPHTMNTQHYFDGNITLKEKELSYLLPIKPMFFNFFTIEDLKDVMQDGKHMLEMESLAGKSGVRVKIRIPIKGNGSISYIEYERTYYSSSYPDIKENKGNIIELKFTGFIMPQIKFKNIEDAIYNISCIQYKSSGTTFSFLKQGEKVDSFSPICRDKIGKHQIKSDNYLLEKCEFDCIQVQSNSGHCGIIVPIFKEQNNINSFDFAIDLGTSNTHIEFKNDTSNSKVFSFSAGDEQLCEIFSPSFEDGTQIDLIEETELIEKDFIPAIIGNGDFCFPTRTVLSCSEYTNWNEKAEPYTLVNLPFTYEKRIGLPYNKFKYNIKWGRGESLRIMEAYIHCLMLILRNKVLLNDGDLSKTKITWFYPISMPKKRINSLKDIWNNAYNKYFGQQATSFMTESVAPIQYFFKRYATATNLINIDIGGGTTDIAFAKNKEVQYVTSFRFASNTLFEDSFSELNNNNGIVDYFKEDILRVLKERSNLFELVSVFDSSDNEHPANMASFLFSLKDNSLIRKEKINEKAIDFNYILHEDENFKVVFLIFYTSIIYHIAQMIKALNLEVPRHISFSGNGSKVIRVISTDSKVLADYTKLIFETIIGKPYGKELELLGLDRNSNPKESTCKGGIIGDVSNDSSQVKVFKSDCSGIVDKETYASVNDDYKKRTIAAVEDFFKFTLVDMDKKFNFDKNFGVTKDSIKIAIETATKDLSTFLDKGISQRRNDVEENDVIDETFFFYPIKGAIQAISDEIYKSLKND